MFRSDDYSTSPDPRTSLKAMVLNKVVVGKGYKMTQDNTSLTAPPAGFDSVCNNVHYRDIVVLTALRTGLG